MPLNTHKEYSSRDQTDQQKMLEALVANIQN